MDTKDSRNSNLYTFLRKENYLEKKFRRLARYALIKQVERHLQLEA